MKIISNYSRVLFLLFCLVILPYEAKGKTVKTAPWTPKKATIMTPFAADVDMQNPRGEYPRPQLVRSEWMSLNGIWQFQPLSSMVEALPRGPLSRSILVPFPEESALSGIMEHHDCFCYKRQFTVPQKWTGKQLLLHFDAVDYECEVFVNGRSVGTHKGGYDPFTFDITSYLKAKGAQELALKVKDPTDAGGQPRGKQTLYPGGIMYTSVSGIWQPVWIEPVEKAYISSLNIVPDVDNSSVNIRINEGGKADKGDRVSLQILDGGSVVATSEGTVGEDMAVRVPDAKLWSPDHPFLYDLKITLKSGSGNDEVSSYFGMRKISIAQSGPYKRLMLNNKFLFQIGPLDQGFWPDGIYTAPTDKAIRNDIEMMKKFGFNMVRKHIKVEPMRWYYWCDKLGLMVWQDMPSANSYTSHPATLDRKAYYTEMEAMVRHLINEPCIIMWVLYNESQGQFDTEQLCSMVRHLDASRLINQASGSSWVGVGDVKDLHQYPAPGCPSSDVQALACGEYGGIKYLLKEHCWSPKSFGYTTVESVQALNQLYDDFARINTNNKTDQGLSAAVYTQLTDVETEINGLMTYDRVVKPDVEGIARSNRMMINDQIRKTIFLPTALDKPQTWSYTESSPSAEWYQPTFDASAWKQGKGGFGKAGMESTHIGTEWTSSDIWLRGTFRLDMTDADLNQCKLSIFHDEDCEVYINGILAYKETGFNNGYETVMMRPEARAAIKTHGDNLIAVHCKQTSGGQYIDLGIVSYSNPETGK